MKRFLFSILVVVAVLMIVGTVGDMYLHSEHGFVNYQKKLANKDSIISELRESISILNYRVEYLQITMDGIKEVDSTLVDDVIHRLWYSHEDDYLYLKP